MSEDKIVTMVVPLQTRHIFSKFNRGTCNGDNSVSIEVKVESDIVPCGEDNGIPLYMVETVVRCFNTDCNFDVIVALATLVIAQGNLDDIVAVFKAQFRRNVFAIAEKKVLELTAFHGMPLRIQLLRFLDTHEEE